jgi:DNA polymerase I
MKRLTFDIETNGFWPDVSNIWCLVTEDIDTKEVKSYSDYDPNLPSLKEGLNALYEANILVGHNIIGYDLMVLEYLTGWKRNPKTTLYDTWIMSMTNRFKRSHAHSLAGWGSHLGYPKMEWTDFTGYSQGMLEYCIRDVQLNTKVYLQLVEEAKKLIQINSLYKKGLQVEMRFSELEAEIRGKGWLFDMPRAKELLTEMETKLSAIESRLEPLIGMVCVKVDGADETKEPKWRKDGFYSAVTAKYFDIDPASGRDDYSRLVDGPYCRVSFDQGKLSSDKVLKAYLYSIGWEPDEWNVERINGKFVNKSPKLTDSSLEKLGSIGTDISEYNTIKNRRGVLAGWIENASRDNRVHGKMWTIGTPTFRCRHEVIANLPSVGTMYGEEMRSLLICEPGTVIVGADSSGNQMRGLCHYIGNDEFTNEVINGDVHQRNADALGVSRKLAKPFLYAFLFGGGAGKLGLILSGVRDAKLGQTAIDKFQNSIPGLKELKEKLDGTYSTTSNRFGKENGFIRGLDGRLVFVGSPHQVLNYLLQTAEGITCKAAAVYLKDKLIEHGIQHYFCIHYHDELGVVCKEDDAELVAELAVEAFTEAPKWFGVECMSGDAKIGKNYAAVH